MAKLIETIKDELKEHAPFTFFGALVGIIFMFLFRGMSQETAHQMFFVFHPMHVLLSALATASMYQRHQCPANKKRCNVFILLIIGYMGAIGIATLSDSLMPYLGEVFLDMPHRHMHVGFLERPWLINLVAIIGVAIAYFNPNTKFPHLGHVLLSTWASIFHIMAAKGEGLSAIVYAGVMLFLFLSVWLPCCISDIVFPLLFVTKKKD
ncbi:MAG: hypothetical protein GY853_00360 [PVC group bacterium]|nr:hypothetical protein [PVC group bacterium]